MATPLHMGGLSCPAWIYPQHLWEPIIYLLQNFGQVPTVCRIKCKFLTLTFNKTLVIWSHCYFYSFPGSYYHPSLNLCPNLSWLIIPKYYFSVLSALSVYTFSLDSPIPQVYLLVWEELNSLTYLPRLSSDLRYQLHALW